MKKALSLILVLIFILSLLLTSCAGDGNTDRDTTTEGEKSDITTVAPDNSDGTTKESEGTTADPIDTTIPGTSNDTQAPDGTVDPDAEYNKNASKGLSFVSNCDGTCYVSGIGTCADTEIIIPSRSPEGDLVTGIGENAFKNYSVSKASTTVLLSAETNDKKSYTNCTALASTSKAVIGLQNEKSDEGLTSVTIPDSVTSIGDFAFANCKDLTDITIPDSVTSIGGNVFDDTAYYTDESNWDNGVLYIGNHLIEAKKEISGFYSIKDGTLTIACFAFWMCGGLEGINIPESVTSIGHWAFSDCTKLSSIDIPSSVTSIGESAFQETEYYNNQSNWDNGVLYIDNHLIRGEISSSYNIKEGTLTIADLALYTREDVTATVNIPNSVTHIGNYAFYGCSGLTEIKIPNSVLSIGECAFLGTALTAVTIPKSVTHIEYDAFQRCSALETITVEPENTVYHSSGNCLIKTEVKALIAGCKTSVIPTDGSVTSIGNCAFREHTGLTSINIPDSVTHIGWAAFQSCSGLTAATLGNSIKHIESEAFSMCSNLTNITLPNSVATIGEGVFRWCDSLTAVTICGPTNIGRFAFSECKSLTVVDFGEGVLSIGEGAFNECVSLNSINIPDSVVSIGNNAFYNTAFYNTESNRENGVLYSGKHLINAKYNISGTCSVKEGTLTIAGGAFYGCDSLTGVTIPDSVIDIGKIAFAACGNLSDITVGSGNTVYHSNGNCLIETAKKSLIAGCKTSIIPNDGSVIYIYDNAFFACTGLTNIIIPGSITSIGNEVFFECTSLENITIGEGVTNIGYNAFGYCINLNSCTLPNSITSIGYGAFSGCSNLKNISIPGNLKNIEEGLFGGCSNLESITIPDSVTSIADHVFSYCTGLTSITFEGKKSDWEKIDKGYYWNYNTGEYTVYCTDRQITKADS